MRCPVCLDADLVPHIRDGIEIDHCSRCRGMWLDRGELEKLLDLVEARSPEARITSPEPPHAPAPLPSDVRRDDDRYRHDDHVTGRRPKKRKSAFAGLLEDVFEALD